MMIPSLPRRNRNQPAPASIEPYASAIDSKATSEDEAVELMATALEAGLYQGEADATLLLAVLVERFHGGRVKLSLNLERSIDLKVSGPDAHGLYTLRTKKVRA